MHLKPTPLEMYLDYLKYKNFRQGSSYPEMTQSFAEYRDQQIEWYEYLKKDAMRVATELRRDGIKLEDILRQFTISINYYTMREGSSIFYSWFAVCHRYSGPPYCFGVAFNPKDAVIALCENPHPAEKMEHAITCSTEELAQYHNC